LVYQPQTTPVETTSNFKSLSVQEAKSWYMQQQFTKLTQPQGTSSSFSSSSNSNSVTSTNVIPIWAKAVNSLYGGQKPIVVIPFAEPSFFKYTRYQTAYLIIFRQNDNTMKSRIMAFEADPTVQSQNPLDIQTFSGVTYQVNEHGNIGLVYKCLNGVIVAELKKDSSSLGVRDECEGPGPGSCYGGWGDKNTNDGSWLRRLGNWLSNHLSCANCPSSNGPSEFPFPDRFHLNGGIDIPDPTGGPSGGGGLPLPNMLNERNFNSVNVTQMTSTCQNSDYEDMVTFGLRLSDPSMIANAPALVTFKGLGHQWANYYLNAARHHYKNRLNNVDFSTALLTVVQNRNNPNFQGIYQEFVNGISPSSNDGFVRAAYAPLIGNYDRMMTDWSNTNGNCAAFSYTTAESFDNFKGLFADNLFQELNISAAGIDAERKQQAVSWLFMTDFMNQDCIKTYFEACRQYPTRMAWTTPYTFSSFYDQYTSKGFTAQEFSDIFTNSTLFQDANTFLNQYNFDEDSKKAVKGVSILAKKNDLIGLDLDSQLDEIKAAFKQEDDPILGLAIDLFVIDYLTNVALLKKLHPSWSKYRVAYEASKESLHLALDICGVVPFYGEPCDFVNGIFYTIDYDGTNAFLSFASTIPIAGWVATSAKFGVRVIGTSGRTYRLTYKVVNGIVEFGSKKNLRDQLRRVLNLSVGDGLFAHHIIPLDLTENANLLQKATQMIQKAASFKAAFHPNEVNNGIALVESVHSGGHSVYISKVKAALETLYDANGGVNITPQSAHQLIQGLMAKIRNEMLIHPTTHIDNLIF
jgi:hypothetical protein